MTFALASYGAAVVAYALLAALLALSRQAAGQGRWLLAAVAGTALWGVLVVAILDLAPGPVPLAVYSADALRALLWTACLLRALPDTGWPSTRRVLTTGSALLTVLAVTLPPLLGSAYGPLVLLGRVGHRLSRG
jgi:hypothetical protein